MMTRTLAAHGTTREATDRPDTAIPCRFVAERNRVLAILARWTAEAEAAFIPAAEPGA
ncbi:MAG: hypothetical protein AB7L66_05080 [Gemmatimonadales bacterium]